MPESPSNRDLLAVVRAWAAGNYPGCELEHISIHLRHVSKPIRLAELPIPPPPQSDIETVREDERGDDRSNGVHPCVKEILQTLKEVGRPLTTTLLKQQMAKRGFVWDERTIKRYLAVLMEDGTIDNPKDSHPRGYRIVCPDLVDGGS